MLCGIDTILRNISSFILNVRIFHKIMSIPWNNAMDLNNVMTITNKCN